MSDLSRRSFLKFGSVAALVGAGAGAVFAQPKPVRSDIRRAVTHRVADNDLFTTKYKAIWKNVQIKAVPGSFSSDSDCRIAISCISNIALSKYVYKALAKQNGSDTTAGINFLWDMLEPLIAAYEKQVVAIRELYGHECEPGWQQRERQDAINRHVHGFVTLYSCTDHLPPFTSTPRSSGFEVI